MIVDCHTHLKFDGAEYKTAEQLACDQSVDKCIILAGHQTSSDQANAAVSHYIKKYRDKLIGFAVVNPVEDRIDKSSVADLKDKLGLKGIVVYCSASGFHPCHSRAMQFYEIAQELSLPVFFDNQCGSSTQPVLSFSQPFLIDEIARAFDSLKIIIGRMGWPFTDQTIAMITKHKNVYADLTIDPAKSWQVYNTVLNCYEASVLNKLFFGSGFPYRQPGQCIETLLGFNKLIGDQMLPAVPRGEIRNIIERDVLKLLDIE